MGVSSTCSGALYRHWGSKSQPRVGGGGSGEPGGSPMVVEFAAVAALCILWVGAPEPLLPARRARVALLRCLLECHAYALGYPALGPWDVDGETVGTVAAMAAPARHIQADEEEADEGREEQEHEREEEYDNVGDDDDGVENLKGGDGDGDAASSKKRRTPATSPLHFRHILITDILTSAGLLLWQGEFALCLFASSWTDTTGNAHQGGGGKV